MLANSSIAVTAGAGETVATQTAGAKKHQVIIPADAAGRIIGTQPLYLFNIVSQVHVAVANTVHWDLFNAHASLIVRVLSIRQIPNVTTAVTGVVFDWTLGRTTTVGAGGVTQTAWLADTVNDGALDVAVTCRSKPTSGAAASTILSSYSISSEETSQSSIDLATKGGLELVPAFLGQTGKGIVLNPGQGLRVVQVTNSAAGNTGWLLAVTTE